MVFWFPLFSVSCFRCDLSDHKSECLFLMDFYKQAEHKGQKLRGRLPHILCIYKLLLSCRWMDDTGLEVGPSTLLVLNPFHSYPTNLGSLVKGAGWVHSQSKIYNDEKKLAQVLPGLNA